MFDRLMPAIHLKRCALWKGSLEQHTFDMFGLRESVVRNSITKLEACDDLTDREVEWLEALRKTLEEVS